MLIHGGAIAFSPFEATEKKKNIPRNNILVLPADLVAETANSAELAAGLQTEDTESLGNNDLLLLVVGGRDTLEDLKSLQRGGTSSSLVGNHATDSLEEDLGGGTVMEGARLFRVDDMAFVKEVVVSELNNCVSRCCTVIQTVRVHTLLRKKLPEILISSHRTTTIFWPERICLETMEASRPSK